jgi:hypothetical protein
MVRYPTVGVDIPVSSAGRPLALSLNNMPFFETPQDVHISHGVLTDVARDYNSSHTAATWNTGIITEGSSGGRGGDGATNINIHNVSLGDQHRQGGSQLPVSYSSYVFYGSRHAHSVDHLSR